MVNPVDIGLRIAQVLDSIGIKMGSYIGKGSNVKKAMFGGKPTMFKPNALEALRGTNANFDDALRLIENEAQFIVNATDAEKIAFLNNVNDYKQFGGPLKQDVVARTDVEQGLGSLKGDIEDLQSSTKDLLTTAKSMKADAEKGLKSAEDDLKTFLETGGNPLKKKETKFLGGSMHEEGQIRTGIRQFLQNELKNGRIKLDALDTERVMKYFPTIEDDPILVFKKIYGDEAYNKAGSFPGAFEIGEDFNHYEKIFRDNMGEDILKVKDKKYVGDGRLLLTESEEIRTPTPDDDDIPFAEGGIADIRVGFVKGKGVTAAKNKVKQIIEYITSKFTPMDAMKEVNKVIGKQGKYKNLKLTQKDIDEIVENTNDFIFQRDPDNKFVEGSIKEKTEYLDEDDVLERDLFAPKSDTQVFKDSEGGIKGITMGGDDKFKKAMSEAMEEGIRESENMKRLGLDPSKMEDALKYDKMKEDGQLEKNVTGLADMSESETLMKKYPGMNKEMADQIANDTDPNRKANIIAMVEQTFKLSEKGKSGDEIIQIFKDSSRTEQADGGITRLRNGYYGGGQAMVEPDLSDIGHGSDALMGRTRLTAPGSQATTSTGLNYLLGEDNDNVRVPFRDGLGVEVPPAKPYTPDMFEKDSMTLLKGMYGTGKDSNKFLYNEMIKKGNILRNQGVERETVIEIIRNNKDKINAFLETQTGDKKSFEGMADGGPARKGFRGGGSDASTSSFSQSFDSQHGTNTASRANTTVDARQAAGQRDADRTNDRIANTALGRTQAFNTAYPPQKSGILNNPFIKSALRVGAYTYNPALLGTDLRTLMQAKDLYDRTKQEITNPNYEIDDLTLGIVSEQQQKEIDKAAKTANLMNDTGQLTDIEKNTIFENAKPFDDQGSSGVFGIGATEPSPMTREEFDTYVNKKGYADGGIAGLRQGYSKGKGVDLARRGFLKVLGGTVGAIAAFKSGALKILGKTAATKTAPKVFIAAEGSGAPAWFEGMVNKVLADGLDITKKAATMDGQVVKSLDTPTGKVDVTIDRTGNIDVNYMGDNTVMGEGVDMRYVVGQADEGTKGVKPMDEFEAVETIPEGQMYSPDDYQVEFGENATSNVKNLYSDTSELAELGGQKPLIKEISESIKKRQTLKQINENPDQFASDNLPDYDY